MHLRTSTYCLVSCETHLPIRISFFAGSLVVARDPRLQFMNKDETRKIGGKDIWNISSKKVRDVAPHRSWTPEKSVRLFRLTLCIAKDIEVPATSCAVEPKNLFLTKACLQKSLKGRSQGMQNPTNNTVIESQNTRLEGTLRITWSNPSWQNNGLDKMAQHPVQLNLTGVQCWGFHHFPGEIILVTHCPRSEQFSSCVQSESSQE